MNLMAEEGREIVSGSVVCDGRRRDEDEHHSTQHIIIMCVRMLDDGAVVAPHTIC